MKKKFFPIVLVLILCTPASAANKSTAIYLDLSFQGTTAHCVLSVHDIGKQIDAVLELWHGSTMIDSWTASSSGFVQISENVSVTKGETYTLKAYVTLGGVQQPVRQVTKTC